MAGRTGAIMTVKLVTNDRIAETSSLGNQEKWLENGIWYKLDQFGYEALTETIVSKLLECSNIETDTPFTFVRYQMERLHVHGYDRVGCASKDFLQPGESLITVNRLLTSMYGSPLKQKLEQLSSNKKRIAYLAQATAECTGLEHFPAYLTLLFELDGLILNDDRHLNNIAVIEKQGVYRYCPIFDNGAGLLSNTRVLPMDIDPKGLIPSLEARPFCTTFNRQILSATGMYGVQLQIPQFTCAELMEWLRPMLTYYAERDRSYIADRVCTCILQRQKRLPTGHPGRTMR